MKRHLLCLLVGVGMILMCGNRALARGFGGGYRAGGYGGARAGGFEGYRGGYGDGYRSASTYSGYRGGFGATSSYDRSWSGARGGSVNVEGARGAAVGPYGGVAAGGRREVTATGPEGRTYTGAQRGGVAVGPYGRTVGGGERAGVASGPHGTVAGGWRGAYAGSRFPTDAGLAHYSSFGAAGMHGTSYWSHGYVTTRAGYVRTNFGYYNSFRPAWYNSHPGCWFAAGWAANTAWRAATWPMFASWYSVPAAPIDYDYGNTVVYNNNNVFVNGQDVGSAQVYSQQAIALADQGQKANAPTDQEWRPLGVFALTQGDEKTSNNIFQLAANKDGIIRGNYYDGLMDTTSPVFGSVDVKTQRAAWTIGKKKDRVFEAGIYNLTNPETPVLVHLGERTQQMLLVRVEPPKDSP